LTSLRLGTYILTNIVGASERRDQEEKDRFHHEGREEHEV